jgi:hypothetical protein
MRAVFARLVFAASAAGVVAGCGTAGGGPEDPAAPISSAETTTDCQDGCHRLASCAWAWFSFEECRDSCRRDAVAVRGDLFRQWWTCANALDCASPDSGRPTDACDAESAQFGPLGYHQDFVAQCQARVQTCALTSDAAPTATGTWSATTVAALAPGAVAALESCYALACANIEACVQTESGGF